MVQTALLSVSRILSEPIGHSKLTLVLTVHIPVASLAIPCACKLYFLVLKLFLNELLGVSELGQLDLFLLDDEWGQLPLKSLFVPLGLLFDLVYLVFGHQETHDLVQEIELFRLLSNCIQEFFVFLRIFFVDIFELVLGTLELDFELFDDFPTVFDFILQGVIVLLLLQQLLLLAFLLIKQLLLIVPLFLQL